MNMVLLCPSRAPIIVIRLSKRRSEWIAWPSVSLVARFRWQTWTTTRKKSLSMNTSTYGELCAWFDSIGDSVCVSIDTNCHSHHYHHHGQTGRDCQQKRLKPMKVPKFSFLFFSTIGKTRRVAVFTLSGKTQVNIDSSSLLILRALYITHFEQVKVARLTHLRSLSA